MELSCKSITIQLIFNLSALEEKSRRRRANILSDAVLSRASVLATILILNVRDIDMTYHVVVHRHVLADEEA